MYRFIKRTIDLTFAFVFLIFCFPILCLISLLIKVDSFRDPILYKGIRTSNRHDTFFLYKFRTMIPHEEVIGDHSTAFNDKRLTDIGKFLRKFKLDELPQFYNVLIGEMSLIGPRPQVTYYTSKYENEYLKILDVKPGITDLASIYFIDMDSTLGTEKVNKKYEAEIEPLKNELRLAYVTNMSLKLDFYIFLLTLLKILRIVNEEFVTNFLIEKKLLNNERKFSR